MNRNYLKLLFCMVFFLVPFLVFAANTTYVPMEKIPGFEAQAATSDFYTYISAVYKFGIWAVGIAAFFMIIVGGFMYITSAGNNASMEKAKTVITDAIVGLILAMLSYLLLYIINPDLVRIKPLAPVGAVPATTQQPGTTTAGGADCANATSNKSNICEGVACSTAKCDLNAYNALIDANKGSIPANIIKSIICRESSGDPNAKKNNSFGLMQVDLSSTIYTEQQLYNPETNIKEGIRILNSKISSVSGYSYSATTPYENAFASYNCCDNGDNPNSVSQDCNSSNGWGTIPKWACPIKPGTGTFNMCAVKFYACDVEACASQY